VQHEYYIYTFCLLFIKEDKESSAINTDTAHIITDGRKLPALKFPTPCPLLPVKVKVKCTIEEAVKDQRGSRSKALPLTSPLSRGG
jgi:hypothetical protein